MARKKDNETSLIFLFLAGIGLLFAFSKRKKSDFPYDYFV